MALGEVKLYLRDVRDETIDLSFENRLSKVVDSGVLFITEHPRLARIYFRLVYSGDSPNRKKIVNELQDMSDDYLGNIIQDAMDRNELNPNLDKSQSVFFLDAVLNRFLKEYHLVMNQRSQDTFDKEEWVKGITKLFTKGLS